MDQFCIPDLWSSMGIAYPGAITLHNHLRCLQHLDAAPHEFGPWRKLAVR